MARGHLYPRPITEIQRQLSSPAARDEKRPIVGIMSAVSLAIIGKGNEPLYLCEFGSDDELREDDAALFGLETPSSSSSNNNNNNNNNNSGGEGKRKMCSLRQEFILHAALDRFVELNGPPPGFAWRHNIAAQYQQQQQQVVPDPQFVGLLGPWEDLRLYGWMTTTQIKFLVAIQDAEIDGDIVGLLRKLHQIYVEYRLNPLGPLTGPIQSTRFDEKVRRTIEAYNRSVM
eukprot:scaffold2069_cov187-Amphora_coffeaeformis.AAC.41